MAMWQPAADLAPFISGYHFYAVGKTGGQPHRGAFEPAWASLRIAVAGGDDWRVRPFNAEWLSPGRISLFGPSSRLAWSESGPGILVSAGIRPRGWRRFFSGPAREWADRVDAVSAMSACTPETICECFASLAEDADVPRAFDALFRQALRPPTPDDAAIAHIEAALVDPAIASVSELSLRTGLPVRRVERLAHRAFGFPPKILLRRARFLRSLHAMRAARRGEGSLVIDPGYTDYSHFIRDSHAFLGMSPQAFLEIDMPLLKSSLELRRHVLGTPAQALDRAPDWEPGS
ncbi:MAG: helix-turn-helix domain-containing protein [Tsuneonella sp.]